ncbi:hypothetical protein DFH09DRAFT_833229, partial [Mycena vulgaris]
LWAASRLALGEPSDGGRARVPTLRTVDPVTRIVSEAVSNEEKSRAFHREFFPAKMPVSSVPPDAQYPAPAYRWEPISDALLHRAIKKMKPYKAARAGSFANCIFTENAHLLVPYYGPIFRSLDALEYYPEGWNGIDSIVLRKPGKANYTDPGAFRPVCLTDDEARLLNATKTLQITTEVERAGILPPNHYG